MSAIAGELKPVNNNKGKNLFIVTEYFLALFSVVIFTYSDNKIRGLTMVSTYTILYVLDATWE